MLTPTDLHELAMTAHTGMGRGRVQARRRAISRPGQSEPAPAVRGLLDHLLDVPVSQPGERPRHPSDDVRLTPRVGEASGRQPRELNASDHAWLARLPTDPGAVSYTDAVALAELHADVAPRSSDARLVESHWRPVRERFDRAQAEHELRAARTPLPELNTGALVDGFAEAIAATTSELDETERHERARTLTREVLADRAAARDKAIADAQDRIAELDSETQRAAATV